MAKWWKNVPFYKCICALCEYGILGHKLICTGILGQNLFYMDLLRKQTAMMSWRWDVDKDIFYVFER